MTSRRSDREHEEGATLLDEQSFLPRKRWDLKLFLILVLAGSNVFLILALTLSRYRYLEGQQNQVMPVDIGWYSSTEVGPSLGAKISGLAIVAPLPLKPVQFHWYTPYSSENDTAANMLWDRINTAHGHISIDHTWAATQHWNYSMPVPGDESKGLYLLRSYHQLHCLKIVRKVFLEAVSGQPLSYPVQHARHCFDYYRQYIMCHADNTPLYTLGQHTAGDGQVHMCRDWDALRDYATKNSACFQDRVGIESLRDQFGNCDGGVDGLEDV